MNIELIKLVEYKFKISRKIKQVTDEFGGTNTTLGYVADVTEYSGDTRTMYRLEDKSLKKLINQIDKKLNPGKKWRIRRY